MIPHTTEKGTLTRKSAIQLLIPTAMIAVSLLLLFLAACNSGGSLAGGGIGGTGTISVGTITGLGSIFVNGVEFETTQASVDIDGVIADETFLKIGMVVRVNGTVNPDGLTGTAQSVTFNNNMEGPITNMVGNTLDVICQPIQVDGQTVYDGNIPGNDLAGLTNLWLADPVNTVVQVSGLLDSTGTILATHVEYIPWKTANNEVEVTGSVSNLADQTFEINGSVVNTNGANFEGFGGSGPAENDYVEASGLFVGCGQGTNLFADEVENIQAEFMDDDELEIEGHITVLGLNQFTITSPVGVLDVTYDNTTLFEDGSTANDLVIGLKVEIEGRYSGTSIFAAEISIDD
jgi:hypothetical protein